MTDKIKIYCFGPMDRSGRVRWLLEEIGVPYEDHVLDYQKEEHKQDAYLKINPVGAVPSVEVDGEILTESAAICLYFADKYADKGLAPKIDSADRGQYLRWMVFVTATAEPIAVEVFKIRHLPDEEREKRMAEIKTNFVNIEKNLASVLGDREYFIGNTFSAADIMVSTLLHWCKMSNLIEEGSKLDAYLQKMKSRPAAEKCQVFAPFPM